MSPEPNPVDPRYVQARRILLDALEALGAHRDAVIVAGAQAIYLRTGQGELAIAPYTTDGDLVLNPSRLAPHPEIEAAMREAGFELALVDGHVEPGVWIATATVEEVELTVPVDLIVPDGVAVGRGRRGARLGVHGNRAARRIPGLEAVLVDHAPLTVAALDPRDARSVSVNVAGLAALLVAKCHKLHDRTTAGRPRRLDDKDAADVVRIMQASPPGAMAASVRRLLSEPPAERPTEQALGYLRTLFSTRTGAGTAMAVRALRVDLPAERVELLCTIWTAEVLESVAERNGP